jgi:hypothetical protein
MMKTDYVLKEALIHLRKLVYLVNTHGVVFVIRLLITVIGGYFYYRIFKSNRTFLFQGRQYKYLYHHFNVTWTSERSVEIPIIRDKIEEYRGRRILELGNVFSHYYPINHDIIDKHDPGKGVINQDIVEFHPSKKYDLIFSISTLEHVGWDEHIHYYSREPGKVVKAINNLKRCLKHNGECVVTFPVGYNSELDTLLDSGTIQFTKCLCMKRISSDNAWVEAKWADIRNASYDAPFISANGLVIGCLGNSNHRKKRQQA